MNRSARIKSFGAAALMVIAGAPVGIVLGGTLGQVVALVLIALGLVLAVSLVFLEIGLSEDRERAQDERRKPRRTLQARRRRPPRQRSHRNSLPR